MQSSITGTATYRAGGGAGTQGYGGTYSGGLGGGAGSFGSGTANTGGGGGGGAFSGYGGNGGPGGSGVVILRYPSSIDITVGAGLTSSTSVVGARKITVFTAGSGQVSFT